MLAEQRRRKVLDILQEQGAVTTAELSKIFSVSEITIRKDLDRLAERNLLLRTHGGAISLESTAFEPSHSEKELVYIKEKKRIGKKAATLIKDNSTIFLSTGTTTAQIIPYLKDKKNLNVITNSLVNGYELAKLPNVAVTIIGGNLRRRSFALVGPLAEESFANIYVDQLFLGVNGISRQHGLTTPNISEAKVCRLMVDIAREVIVVVDHSKFGKVTHSRIGGIDLIDVIVTSKEVEPKFKKEFKNEDIGWIEA
jgi:DeoR/GlpR family transcriptional regulator of sugar metabolism